MQKIDQQNLQKEQADQIMEEQKRQQEEFMSFGPPLFHRVMRRVVNGDYPQRVARRKESLEAEAQARAQATAQETPEKVEAEMKAQ